MAASSLTSLIIFFITFQFQPTTQTPPTNPHLNTSSLLHELQQANLKIAQLELISEQKIRDINVISSYIEEKEKAIQVITLEINRESTVLLSAKDDLSQVQERLDSLAKEDDLPQAQERIDALEKEVRRLWEVSRRNNFETHNLELKLRDAEDGLVAMTSRVENMVAIVSEQWIQVQHLEQAIQMAKMRTLKIKTESILIKCPFFKYVNKGFSHHAEELKGILTSFLPGKRSPNSFISQTCNLLSRVFTAPKYFHHQLQNMIKQALESRDFSAGLANDEVVFVMASALIIFPMMSAWVFLSSHFR